MSNPLKHFLADLLMFVGSQFLMYIKRTFDKLYYIEKALLYYIIQFFSMATCLNYGYRECSKLVIPFGKQKALMLTSP